MPYLLSHKFLTNNNQFISFQSKGVLPLVRLALNTRRYHCLFHKCWKNDNLNAANLGQMCRAWTAQPAAALHSPLLPPRPHCARLPRGLAGLQASCFPSSKAQEIRALVDRYTATRVAGTLDAKRHHRTRLEVLISGRVTVGFYFAFPSVPSAAVLHGVCADCVSMVSSVLF